MLYFNRHYDKYMLDIARPDYYLNHHMTDIEGIRVESKLALGKTGSFLGNIDFNRERIKSTRLGKHGRDKNSFSLAWQNYELGFLGYDLSLLVDDYSEYDTKVLPQAAIFFMLEPHTKLRASFAESSREPTYTELYYDSPANKGNANLSPEQAYNYEAGIDLDLQQDYNVFLSLTVFRRDSSDLIDWVKDTQSQAYYQARNITKVKTEGVDVGLSFKPIEWAMLKGGYTYIDSDIEKDYSYISKYALNHPDHKVSSQLDFILPFGIQSVRLLYKDRKKYANYLVMGCDLNYKVNKNSSLFVVVDNIFNSGREDIRDNKLPGREINVGIRLVF
jgi:iron complex outermembrane receptor protein